MKNNSQDNFWTVEKVVEAFQSGVCRIKECGETNPSEMTAVYIRDKIKEILKETEFAESIFRRRAKKQDGHFIFEGDESVPDKVYNLICYYNLHRDTIHSSYMSNEEYELVRRLFEIRPKIRQKPCNNEYIRYRKALREPKGLWNSKDCEDFYTKKYIKIYKQKLFVKVNVENGRPGKCVRSNIYLYQLYLINKWQQKWSFIMKAAKALRTNERIFYGYACGLDKSLTNEDRKSFYLEGFWFDELEEYLNKNRMDEEEMYNECYNLYYYDSSEALKNTKSEESLTYEKCYEKCEKYVEKILTHALLQTSIDDYLYMWRKAIAELEDIYKELKKELEIEQGYDELVYGLKQVMKMVEENGLEGKKYKRLEKILDESMRRIQRQNVSDEIDIICEKIKGIVKEEKDCSVAERRIVKFCGQEIKRCSSLIKNGENWQLTYEDYEEYFKKEISDIEIGEKELIKKYQKVLIGIKMKQSDSLKRRRVITDFLPEDEKEKYWNLREYYTGREII